MSKSPCKSAPGSSEALAGPSTLELSLRMELEQLERELAVAKGEALEAKQKNEWLREEVRRVEEETREYEAYMGRKTAQEQERIKTIAEFNKQEMEAIEEEKKRRLQDYEKQKRELQDSILQYSAELERSKKQLADLSMLQARRDAQLQEIRDLEATLEQTRAEHFEKMQVLKAQCFDDKIRFQRTSVDTFSEVQKNAKQEALRCLEEQSQQVRQENGALRRELLSVLALNKELRAREEILKKQSKELAHQVEFMAQMNAMPSRRPSRRPSVAQS